MDLQPLEELLSGSRKVALEKISSKWGNQPNKPEKEEIKFPNPNVIKSKF
jgi:hypothetical protein